MKRSFLQNFFNNYIVFYSELYQSLFRSISFSEHGLELLRQIIKKDAVVFDIGANIGKFTAISARLTGSAGKVYSFEPVENPRKVLAKMVSLKKLSQVEIYDIGFSDTSRESKMITPLRKGGRPDTMLSYIIPDNHGPASDCETAQDVKFLSLDDFCERNSICRLDFIKCDTEGHEFNVFCGAKKTLAKYQPVIFCEIEEAYFKRNGVAACQIFDLFTKAGYRSFLAADDNRGLKTVKGFAGNSDYFFIPEAKIESIAKLFQVS